MQPARHRSLLLCALVLIGAACSESVDTAPEPASSEGPAVDELMALARVPGLAWATAEESGGADSELHGVANQETGELLTEHTLFEAASLSKPVFATVVLRLAERGEIDLDRPIDQLLSYDRLDHDPRTAQLTPRLVLSHQTGLPNWGGETLEYQSEPGAGFGYSGEGYVYLQRALEETTGLTLDELARREVFDPLGMEHSRFSWAEGDELALATPHDSAGHAQSKRPALEANAASSLHTTAAEYARFVRAWLTGELLDPAFAEEALAPAVELTSDGEEGGFAPLAWGLGWGIQRAAPGTDGAPVYWHWGDNGPFKAFVAFEPRAGQGVVYLANAMNGLAIAAPLVEPTVGGIGPILDYLDYERYDAPGFSERLEGTLAESEGRYGEAAAAFRLALVADPDDEATERRIEWLTDILDMKQRPIAVPEPVLRRYAGSYGPRTLTLEDGSLYYQRGSGSRYKMLPLSETLFVLDGLVVFRLEVQVDGSGNPVALIGHYVNGQVDESPRDSAASADAVRDPDTARSTLRGGGSRGRR